MLPTWFLIVILVTVLYWAIYLICSTNWSRFYKTKPKNKYHVVDAAERNYVIDAAKHNYILVIHLWFVESISWKVINLNCLNDLDAKKEAAYAVSQYQNNRFQSVSYQLIKVKNGEAL